jgi:hypothetical protein
LCESAGLSTLLDEVKADYAEAKRADFLKHVAWDEGVDLVWGQRIGLILGSIEKGLGAPDMPASVQTDSGVKVGGNQPASTVSSSVEKPDVRPGTAQEANLAKRFAVAYAQYRQAAHECTNNDGREPTDQQCHAWLETHSEGDQLPAFDTWQRYVRKARNFLGDQKNTPLAGREHGRSIVSANEVEPPARNKAD